MGLQVIDSKASVVGNVKAVCVDVRNKDLAFRVKTKAEKELDFPWEDVQSVEDVVLLKKDVELSTYENNHSLPESASAVRAFAVCPNCGASSNDPTKFCSRCGAAMG